MRTGQATARAHTNIALAKYWGKRDVALNIPATPSLSAGLDDLWVEADVRFVSMADGDRLTIDGRAVEGAPLVRVSTFLDLVRGMVSEEVGSAQVTTRSNFPTAAGLASSAAAFAALAMAANDALELELDSAELSALARRGSGSAARSLFEGYVELGTSGDNPSAIPIAPASHLPLGVAVAITSTAPKKLSSRRAMRLAAETSPYYTSWVETAGGDLEKIREAILERRFRRLAECVEHNCLKMHATALTSAPPVVYWNRRTLDIIHRVPRLRADGVKAFFTIDAGPNVVVFFEPADRHAVEHVLGELDVEVFMTEVGGAPMSRAESRVDGGDATR